MTVTVPVPNASAARSIPASAAAARVHGNPYFARTRSLAIVNDVRQRATKSSTAYSAPGARWSATTSDGE